MFSYGEFKAEDQVLNSNIKSMLQSVLNEFKHPVVYFCPLGENASSIEQESGRGVSKLHWRQRSEHQVGNKLRNLWRRFRRFAGEGEGGRGQHGRLFQTKAFFPLEDGRSSSLDLRFCFLSHVRSSPAVPISSRKAPWTKGSPQTFAHLVNFSNNVSQILTMINEPFTRSRCVIYVSCSVHVTSSYACAKDYGLFLLFTHKSTRVEIRSLGSK